MQSSDPTGRKRNVDFANHNINISSQAELLSINYSSIYRKPLQQKDVSELDLLIMKRIDEIHTAHPTWVYRTIAKISRRDVKIIVTLKKIQRLMQVMGVYTFYPKLNLSKRYHAQHISPYLLRILPITHPDQFWGVDISYTRMEKGFIISSSS